MQIQKISNTPTIKPINAQDKQIKSSSVQNCDYSRQYASTSQIPFCANLGIKPKKLLNFDIEKNKVLKQIAEMFKLQPEDLDIKEIARAALRDSIRHIRAKNKRLKEIEKEVDWINADKKLKVKQKIDRLRELKKEAERIQKSKPKPSINPNKKTDEKTDFVLLNKIRAALLKDNLNLKEVFFEYFSGLNEIKTVEELAKMYPKLKIPQNPHELVGKKVENSLTKEFYEEFGRIYSQDQKKAFEYVNRIVKEKFATISEKHGIDPKELYYQVAKPTFRAIANRFKYIKANGFSTINTNNKSSITDTDIK